MKLAHLSRSEFFLTGKFEVESLVAIGMKIHSFENAEHTIGFIRSRVTRIFYIIFIVVACYLSRNLSEFENLEACHNFLSYEISDVTACNVIYETIAKNFLVSHVMIQARCNLILYRAIMFYFLFK